MSQTAVTTTEVWRHPQWWTPDGIVDRDPIGWDECAYCGKELRLDNPNIEHDDPHAQFWGSTRVWCNEDCVCNHAEEAHERMLEQYYGGSHWP